MNSPLDAADKSECFISCAEENVFLKIKMICVRNISFILEYHTRMVFRCRPVFERLLVSISSCKYLVLNTAYRIALCGRCSTPGYYFDCTQLKSLSCGLTFFFASPEKTKLSPKNIRAKLIPHSRGF